MVHKAIQRSKDNPRVEVTSRYYFDKLYLEVIAERLTWKETPSTNEDKLPEKYSVMAGQVLCISRGPEAMSADITDHSYLCSLLRTQHSLSPFQV